MKFHVIEHKSLLEKIFSMKIIIFHLFSFLLGIIKWMCCTIFSILNLDQYYNVRIILSGITILSPNYWTIEGNYNFIYKRDLHDKWKVDVSTCYPRYDTI